MFQVEKFHSAVVTSTFLPPTVRFVSQKQPQKVKLIARIRRFQARNR